MTVAVIGKEIPVEPPGAEKADESRDECRPKSPGADDLHQICRSAAVLLLVRLGEVACAAEWNTHVGGRIYQLTDVLKHRVESHARRTQKYSSQFVAYETGQGFQHLDAAKYASVFEHVRK